MNPLADGCKCPGCEALRHELGNDRPLLAHYAAKLLVRGWAGRTSVAEAAYVRSHAPWAQAAARTLETYAKLPDQTGARAEDGPAGRPLAVAVQTA